MNILSIEQNKLKDILVRNHFKAFSVNQIFEWIYKKEILSFDEMTNLSKDLRDFLNKSFKVCSLKVKTIELSKDEQTKKYLFELEDGYFIESVLILSDKRKTICVSSQVGCPVRCTFCASGKKGLFRNLKAFEIVEQVLHIAKDIKEKPTNIVFMGMGEPLLNFDEVVKAVKIMSDDKYLNISQRRITISTAGILENIKKLKDENLKVYLALSLHGPTDEIRNRIMPYSKKYKLQDILKELRLYFEKTKRDILFEYILIESVNDSIEEAKKLAILLKNFQCTINLIPYNEVENLKYKRPSGEKILKFKNYLISHGLNVVQRYTKGKDIAASCGQLAYKARL